MVNKKIMSPQNLEAELFSRSSILAKYESLLMMVFQNRSTREIYLQEFKNELDNFENLMKSN